MRLIVCGPGRAESMLVAVLVLVSAMSPVAGHAGEQSDASIIGTGIQLQAPDADPWVIRLGGYLWTSHMKSTVTTNGVTVDTEMSFSELLDDLVTGGVLYAEGQNGEWGFSFDAVYMVTRAAEDMQSVRISNEVEQLVIEAAASYRFLEEEDKTFDLLGGLRYTDMDTTIGINFLAIEDDHDWLEPFVGFRFRNRLSEKWSVGARAHVGGFDLGSKFTGGGQVIFTYAVNQNLDLGIGVRYQHIDYEDGAYEMEAHMYGPIFGMIYTF